MLCAVVLSMILVEKATAENCLSCDRVVECLASMRATRDLPCRQIVLIACECGIILGHKFPGIRLAPIHICELKKIN